MAKFFVNRLPVGFLTIVLIGACGSAAAPAAAAPTRQAASKQPKAQPSAISDKQYSYIDPTHLVDGGLLHQGLSYFSQHNDLFANQNYLAIIDYAKPSSQHRLFIINMHSGEVWALPVAHGKGSDPDRKESQNSSATSGAATHLRWGFSAPPKRTGQSRLVIAPDGLSSGNARTRARNVVIHGADYVKEGLAIQGRSWGCPAVPMEDRDKVIKLLKNGSLLYIGLGTPAQT